MFQLVRAASAECKDLRALQPMDVPVSPKHYYSAKKGRYLQEQGGLIEGPIIVSISLIFVGSNIRVQTEAAFNWLRAR